MPKTFEQLISDLRAEPPADLLERISARVARERLRSARRRFALLSGATLASTAAFFVSLAAARSALARSGSLDFFSLLFSDTRTMFAYWQDFAFTLLESLPVGTIAAFLIVALCLGWSVRALVRDARSVRSRHVFNA